MSKPIWLGSFILQLSKLLFYELYYDKLQKYYGDKRKLNYTDCGSFIMTVQTNDIVKDLKETKNHIKCSTFLTSIKIIICLVTNLKKYPDI